MNTPPAGPGPPGETSRSLPSQPRTSIVGILLIGLPLAIAVGLFAGWWLLALDSRRHAARVQGPAARASASLSGDEAPPVGRGMLRLLATPPGVQVLIDGSPRGKAQPVADQLWKGRPFLLPGLPAGKHTVAIAHGVEHTEPIEVDILPDGTIDCSLELWLPNCIVSCKDGSRRLGMVRDVSAGRMCLAVSAEDDVIIEMHDVMDYSMTPLVALRGNDDVRVRNPTSKAPELVIEAFPAEKRSLKK